MDIAIVSLGTTMGWRHGDEVLAEHIEAAGASCELRRMRLGRSRRLRRTMALTDAVEALGARRAAAALDARAVVYSSITAALLQPPRQPSAIRFDSIATLNRPGLGGAWQRRRECTVLMRADLLLPMSPGAREAAAAAMGVTEPAAGEAAPAAAAAPPQIVLPPPVETASEPAPDAPDAVAYAGNPEKRGLDLLCAAWAFAAPDRARLVVGGIARDEALPWLERRGVTPSPGIEFAGAVSHERWLGLVAGARVYVSAARYEDWGMGQMEALAAGVPLVTVPTGGANVALPLARQLAPELVAAEETPQALTGALRAGLDLDRAGRRDYAEHARRLLEPYSDAALRALVAERVLPVLLGESAAR